MDCFAIRRLQIGARHPAFEGHFPGRPIWPGVALLAEVLEAVASDLALSALVGVAPQVSVVKFLTPVLPGALLDVAFETGARSVSFKVSEGGKVASSGQLARVDAAQGPTR